MEHFILDKYSEDEKNTLLSSAKKSIQCGLENNSPSPIEVNNYSENLKEKRASFVTIEINKNLRGCIGKLIAISPLITDVVENAYSAAFSDPRFPKLTNEEFKNIDVSISILTPPMPVQFTSEQNLIEQLEVGKDGLILTKDYFKGTFLPSVWETLREPTEFLNNLKEKAGLPRNFWSNDIKIEKYHTIYIK